ncbi:hypothetical protein HBI25_098510 [Parastagonospora nodorum]|nr:hypothetical protein HBH51_199700 [Parastagonospora nodorum]KAH4013807.1 hypothetical protein HBI09_214160 [Parastagonospora nodorum]KAH4042835.1 hypothetical protein HBH49_243470 [Parastagonospora nodorum]KAH4114418.1 hypothetical protein HBH47_197240 [Parastagonospora nodorum]KAH4187728.1 hypothetical protein HBI95_233920 [Parastagonospora nodorum]
MASSTLSSLFLILLSCTPAFGQSTDTQQVQYNQVLNLNGDMKINSFQFPDRSRVETFSQKQQQIIVNQQTPAIPANQVTGTTGQPFVAISPQSMTISTNGATDLVGGQVQMAITMQNLQSAAVQPDNTYVAMLSPDRQTWMVQETMRSVNSTDMTVRMVKRNQLDGEYMVVGRQTVETNTLVQPFGSDQARSIAIQGTGLQENEFQDGFRMSTRATQPMTMNVDVVDGIDSSMLAALQGQESVNDYRYSVITNLAAVTPSLNQQVTVIQMPINAVRIQKMMQAMGVPPTGQVAIAVAQRGVLQNPGGATGNLGGATAAVGAATRRNLGRRHFRTEVARQVQGQTGAIIAGQAPTGQTQTGQTQTGQTQTGQTQTGQTQTGQTQTGQTQTGQTQTGQTQTGQTQTGQQQQAGQVQAGTPTNNNPVAQKLLLSPTFVPVAANAVLDQTNMRIAIPVRQVDGEYILTMQKMNSVQQAQPAQGQAQAQLPTAAEGQTPTAETGARPAESKAPTAGEGLRANEGLRNGTEPARPAAEKKPEGEKKPERRQESSKDKYGNVKAPQGSIIMTMKMIDDMVDAVNWGGQAAITKMMSEYTKQNTGTEAATGAAKIIV